MILTLLLKTMSIAFARKQVKCWMPLQEWFSTWIYKRESFLTSKAQVVVLKVKQILYMKELTYQDNTSTFQELLNKDISVSIHHINLQILATEMFKTPRVFPPEILREPFVTKTSSLDLCRNDTFGKRQVHAVYHGTESLPFLDPKI